MRREDRYLQKSGRRWHYVRRVPDGARGADSRAYIRVTLKTGSLEIARERRDALEAADDQLWGLLEAAGTGLNCLYAPRLWEHWRRADTALE